MLEIFFTNKQIFIWCNIMNIRNKITFTKLIFFFLNLNKTKFTLINKFKLYKFIFYKLK